MHNKLKAKSLAKYELYHSSDEIFFSVLRYGRDNTTREDIRRFFMAGNYQLVHSLVLSATDVREQLEEVFYRSQNGDESWRGELECRSTSVGDVIRVRRNYWIVAARGFDFGWSDTPKP